MRSVVLIAIFLFCAGPALAESLCAEPAMPMPVDGAALTADQMRAAMADARGFIAQSGLYQECLLKEVEATKAQDAAAGQPFEPMIETSAHLKVDASKKAQEKVSAAANSAMSAYKNHP